MFISNALKAAGCLMMIAGVHPMIAYGVVGLGAAAYSPAKYGILTALLPPQKLVAANAWLESATVGSTILGTVIGGALVSQVVARWVSHAHQPLVSTAAHAALCAVMLIYASAAFINVFIPDTGARYANLLTEPTKLVHDFSHCFMVLQKDKLAQIALWVTTLLWGGGRHAATARAQMGGCESRLLSFEGRRAAGRDRPGHRARRGGGVRVDHAAPVTARAAGVLIGAVAVAMAFYKDLFPQGAGVHIGPFFAPAYILRCIR